MTARKRKPPQFVPLERYQAPPVEELPSLVTGLPLLRLFRPVRPAFQVGEPAPGLAAYWLANLLNEGTEPCYAGAYVVEVSAKSKLPPWTPQELAVAAARKLNEYRGTVGLQRFECGGCTFAARFASNSLWTFCVWSTDAVLCPVVDPWPARWKPGEPLPPELTRRWVADFTEGSHHPKPRDPAQFSKLAQNQFA